MKIDLFTFSTKEFSFDDIHLTILSIKPSDRKPFILFEIGSDWSISWIILFNFEMNYNKEEYRGGKDEKRITFTRC